MTPSRAPQPALASQNPRTSRRSILAAATLALFGATTTGCSRGGGFFLLNLVTGKEPIVLVLASDNPLDLINPFTPYDKLRAALEKETGRPVRLDLAAPFQIEFGLSNGFHDFAVVSPAVYAAMSDRQRFTAIAASADLRGRVERPAVLIVKAGSPIQKVEELRGKTVAFGRSGDSRTFHAGLNMLVRSGVSRDDLKKDVLPVPGSLRHKSDDAAVAQSVLSGESDAGFVDEAWWETLSAQSARAESLGRDKFRAIARTQPLPDTLLIASPKADEKTRDAVREFVLAADSRRPEVLGPLKVSKFQSVDESRLAAWAETASAAPAPATTQPAVEPATETPKPEGSSASPP